MSKTLTGSVALVTGANSGIGRATAHELAARGADVAVSARRRERLEALAADIEAERDNDVLVHPADVTDADAVSELVDDTVASLGTLDVVVNNAGLGRDETTIEELGLDAYHQMMSVNCDGMFYVARAAMPHLKASAGNLIFLESMSGQYPRPASPVYAATKWWTRGLALSVQASVGTASVGVTSVNPTEARTESGNEDGETLAEQIGPDDAASAQDIAEAIAFAAEQDNSNVVQELDFYRRDKFEK